MKTELKDVLHFYIGCKGWDSEAPGEEIMTIIGYSIINGNHLISDEHGNFDIPIKDIKPILRPLSDMTDDEIKYVGEDLKQGTWNAPDIRSNPKLAWSIHHMNPVVFVYLINQGFDLFDLIESGQAIDKTKLKN